MIAVRFPFDTILRAAECQGQSDSTIIHNFFANAARSVGFEVDRRGADEALYVTRVSDNSGYLEILQALENYLVADAQA